MDKQHASIEEQIEFGLDSVDADRTVEVPLRDLLYIRQTLGEYIRFFHNPSHYPSLEEVKKFLGNRDAGALKPLFDCYYNKWRDAIPEDIHDQYNGEVFSNPSSPYYYELSGVDTSA